MQTITRRQLIPGGLAAAAALSLPRPSGATVVLDGASVLRKVGPEVVRELERRLAASGHRLAGEVLDCVETAFLAMLSRCLESHGWPAGVSVEVYQQHLSPHRVDWCCLGESDASGRFGFSVDIPRVGSGVSDAAAASFTRRLRASSAALAGGDLRLRVTPEQHAAAVRRMDTLIPLG